MNFEKRNILPGNTNTEKYLGREERMLPQVTVEENLSPLQKIGKGTRISKDFVIKNERSDVVGKFTLSIARPSNGEAIAHLNTVSVTERGNGYGRAAYLKIIDYLHNQNIIFTSSESQLSRDSKKVWDWLVQEGKAYLVDAGKNDENAQNAGYSTATYRAF